MEVLMKIKSTIIIIFLLLSLTMTNLGIVNAGATDLSWIVSVTYQNVGTSSSEVTVTFYQEGSATPITYNATSLAPGAAASFYLGNISNVPAGFNGNAIMAASQPMVATVVQFHQNAPGETVRMRMLSNGFSQSDVSNQYLIATVLGTTFSRTTTFSIQNIESETITATIKFYNVINGSLAATKIYDIPANSSKYIEMDMPTDTGLPTAFFNGSAIITAVKKSNGLPANIVAAASELYLTKNVGANFEGVPLSKATNKIFLATGLCNTFGLTTYYAIQNASLSNSATISVNYYNTNGSAKTIDGPYTIGPGQKVSINTCQPKSGINMTGFTGSAVVTTSDLTSQIVAIGKAQAMDNPPADKADVFTIFLGESEGSSKLALPFIRWANDTHFNASTNYGGYQRAFIAIQNLETTTSLVNVKYFDKNGGLVATHMLSIPGNSKANSDASVAGALGKNGMVAGEFGYYIDGSFGGGVIIEAHPDNPTAKLIAIARVQHPGAGEDYNAVPIP